MLADPAARPSQVVAALDGIDPHALALLPVVCADSQANAAVTHYRTTWQHVQPDLTGHDLQHLGLRRGLIYRTVLAELRAGRLDGTINTRADEEALVRRYALLE